MLSQIFSEFHNTNEEVHQGDQRELNFLKREETEDLNVAQQQGVSSQDVEISVSLGSPSTADGVESTPVLVSLRPTQGQGRVPTDIICVIDASYSMSDQAKIQNEQGISEATGLTILDVTKHAVRTVFNVLEPSDRLAIVSFSDDGRVDLQLTAMDEAGRKAAEKCITGLQVRGGTNLWAGVETGLAVAAAASDGPSRSGFLSHILKRARAADSGCNRLAHVLLLTDGVPTIQPPKGAGKECEHLREYKENHGGLLPCTLTTFGFGYNLKSDMLTELAEIGGGSYAFIPDSGLVGTVFVNAISNLLTTMAYSAELCLEPFGNAEFASEPRVLGHLATLTPEKKLQVNLGTLQFGQSKDVVVRMRFESNVKENPAKRMPFGRYKDRTPPSSLDTNESLTTAFANSFLRVCLTYRARNAEGAAKMCYVHSHVSERTISAEAEVHCHRLNAASCISQAMNLVLECSSGDRLEHARTVISDLTLGIKASATADDERIEDLVKDLDGQVSEALSRQDWFDRWGKHYLPSLRLAHLHQQCNNFKDPGVQHYAGDFFSEVRDTADDIFLKLPPPKPSSPPPFSGGGGTIVHAPQDMSMFYNVGGGCFDGNCKVWMADGNLKALNQIWQGDHVITPTGIAKVTCVVKTLCKGGKTELVELSGPGGALFATPWHPVRIGGAWCFPSQLANATLRSCPAVYNLVLEGNHPSMLVSGIECSVLGHGLMGPVVEHEYFGTRAIIEDLERMPGWQSGLVELVPENYVRDPTTRRVCGLTVKATEDNNMALLCKEKLDNTPPQMHQAMWTWFTAFTVPIEV